MRGGAADSLVLVGTPLVRTGADGRPRDGVGPTSAPVWEQVVTDAQGRRRFHGAFTGGFSAGYFNTVGSKEGWQPQSFYSSRSQKRTAAQPDVDGNDRKRPRGMRLEDLMDEEDLADMRDSRFLAANQAYGGSGAQAARDEQQLSMSSLASGSGRGIEAFGPGSQGGEGTAAASKGVWDPLSGSFVGEASTSGGSRSDPMASLLSTPLPRVGSSEPTSAAEDSRGKQILARMGWRAGTGLGPRTSARAVRRLRLLNERLEAWVLGRAPNEMALEEDENSYAAKHTYAPPDTHFLPVPIRRHAAHHGLGFGGHYIHPLQGAKWIKSPPLSGGGWVWANTPEEDASVAQSPPSEANIAPPPGWVPDRSRVFTIITSNGAASTLTSKGARPSASTRASLLGERPAPGPAPKLQDYLSQGDLRPPGSPPGPPPGPPPATQFGTASQPIQLPGAAAARSALAGFIPFGTPEDAGNKHSKRSRYLTFLRLASAPGSLPAGALTTAAWAAQHKQSVDAAQSELNEFSAASRIFRPLSSALAGRFASSTAPASTSAVGQDAAECPAKEAAAGEPSASSSKPEVSGHPLRMLGPGHGTRTETRWLPERILSKRMGCAFPPSGLESATVPGLVAEPDYRGLDPSASAPASARTWVRAQKGLQDLVDQRAWEEHSSELVPAAKIPDDPYGTSQPIGSGTGGRSADVLGADQVGLAEDQRQSRDRPRRPPSDLFKAVFGDSSDEDEDQDHTHAHAQAGLTDAPAEPLPALAPETRQAGGSRGGTAAAPAPGAATGAITFVARKERRTRLGGGTTASSLPEPEPEREREREHDPKPETAPEVGAGAQSEAIHAREAAQTDKKAKRDMKPKKKDKKARHRQRGLLSFGEEGEEDTWKPATRAKPRAASPGSALTPAVPPGSRGVNSAAAVSARADAPRAGARPSAADFFDTSTEQPDRCTRGE